jgi:wobble nucleotide-excising tRNase
VYETANAVNSLDASCYYPMPNIARRLLESFLAFKRPQLETLYRKLENVSCDPGQKTRVLRFIETFSHNDQVAEGEHAPSILLETTSVLKDLLSIIRCLDEEHFKAMEALVLRGKGS